MSLLRTLNNLMNMFVFYVFGDESGGRADLVAPQEGTMTEAGMPGARQAGSSSTRRDNFSAPWGPSGNAGDDRTDDTTIGHGADPDDLDRVCFGGCGTMVPGLRAVADRAGIVVAHDDDGTVAEVFVPPPPDGTVEVSTVPLVGIDGGVCASGYSHRFGDEIDVPGGVGGEFHRRTEQTD